MKDTALILTEVRPGGQTEPDREVLERAVTAWLRRELERDGAARTPRAGT